MPWFVDQEYENPQRSIRENAAPSAPPPPEDAPEAVKLVHAALSRSAHLDLSTLVTSRAKEIPLGPPLPLKAPQGRRKRGSTYAGESMFDVPGSIWSWTVVAQVKAGTENRGAIESVVRMIRKTLTTVEPPLPMASKSKRQMANGWAMVDAGDFAVHVLSRDVQQKYFDRDIMS